MKQSSKLIRGGLIIPAILVAGFFVFHFVSAYDSKNAHRALTYEAAEFYNFSFGNNLAQDDVNYLMQGAQEEDTPPRWINHFYDPTTGEGWTAEKMGEFDSALIKVFSSLALSPRPPISAKNWAKNRSAQADYVYYQGDQTWQKAIELYALGDRKNALIALGHTLHLIEDMTVPDHTRGDTHAGLVGDKGSPYENYAKNITSGKNTSLTIAENLQASGRKPLVLPILDNYFEENSKYSNKNFFSEDTINDKNFYLPDVNREIDENKKIIFYAKGNDSYPIYSFKDGKETVDHPLILSAYWDRLSKQAVVSGAGVINLFFQEVEKYKKLTPSPTLPLSTGGGSRTGLISPFGELVKLNNFFVQLFSGVQNTIAGFLPQAGRTETAVNMDELVKEPPPNLPLNTEGGNDSPPPSSPLDYQEGGSVAPASQPPLVLPPAPEIATSLTPRNDTKTEEKLYVSYVIDGDTVTLNNGKDLRLIGMDTPELGEKCADEATQQLKNLVLGKYVTLEKDASETDKYSRLLRFIYVDGTLINAEMVKIGYAKRMTIPPDTKYANEFKILENEAKNAHRGCLWGEIATSQTPRNDSGVGGAPEGEIATSQTPRNDSDKGPYYGGSSWAGAPEQPQNNTVESEIPTSTPEATTSTPETSTSTPESTATSTPETATSTPETSATSTPESSATSTPQIKIIINEIQIAGVIADDEFVELYNPNDNPADITGWNLSKKKSGTESNLVREFSASTTIPARSYFLIVSQKATSTPADTTFSGSSFYITDDSTILLKNNNGEIIDKAGMGEAQDFETAPTLNPPKNQSINRQNFIDTDNNFNDFIISTSTPQGTSSTPTKSEPEIIEQPLLVTCTTPTYDDHKNYDNKGMADISKTLPFPQIASGETATLVSGQTYYIASSSVGPKVPATSRLVIPQGVVIKFGPWEQGQWSIVPPVLIIEGDLEINGTPTNPVVFTTFRDDAYGEKINMSTSTPAPNDWGYVQIDSRKGKNIKIAGAKFLYGGGNDAALIINGDADVDISDTEFLHNRAGMIAKFIYFTGAISISNSNFEYNKLFGAKAGDIKNTSASITGNDFKCNGFGRGATAVGALDIATTNAYFSGGAITISNNNFWGDYENGINYNKSYRLASDTNNANLPAANNYWSDASGPYHATANSAGKGSPVSDYIDFSPWNISPIP